jgi:CRISPR/Cas system CMR-associated protein Cmr5 small subunit
MTVRRVDQGMAAAAAGLLPDKVSRELRTRYRQLRIMTHTAGLAATYAFIAAKAGERNDLAVAYRRAGAGIRARLADLGLLEGDVRRMSATDVLRELGRMDAVQYARASAEVAAFTGWLARLADAVTPDDDGAGDGSQDTAEAPGPPGSQGSSGGGAAW